MNRVRNLDELRRELKATKSGCAGDTIFMAKASLFLIEQIVALNAKLGGNGHRPKRKPSEWQRFFAASMKAGKSAQQAAMDYAGRADDWERRAR